MYAKKLLSSSKKLPKKLKHIVLLPVNKFKTAINWKQLSLPEMQGDSYGNSGCEVFKRGIQN